MRVANKKTKIAKTATDALEILWEEGFFRLCKRKSAVVENLGRRGNHFSDPELGMALKRARHLTRRGKRGNYEYIQKYPFVADLAASAGKKKEA